MLTIETSLKHMYIFMFKINHRLLKYLDKTVFSIKHLHISSKYEHIISYFSCIIVNKVFPVCQLFPMQFVFHRKGE